MRRGKRSGGIVSRIKDGVISGDGKIPIYPTHTCFEDVTDYLKWKLESCSTIAEAFALPMLIVHAIVHPEKVETAYSHAWVEEGDKVISFGLINGEKYGIEFEKIEFYDLYRPLDMTRYTVEEGYLMEKKTGTFPPWEEKYRRLCRDYRGEKDGK